MVSKNPYQVICKPNCKSYKKCRGSGGNKCILKSKFQKFIKGCNYSKEGDCKYCSHKSKCWLIKPYSDKLYETEVKRHWLEEENKKLLKYISKWDEIEENLESYGVNSVTDVVYFGREINTKQKMIDKINRNNRLIKAYFKKEKKLI